MRLPTTIPHAPSPSRVTSSAAPPRPFGRRRRALFAAALTVLLVPLSLWLAPAGLTPGGNVHAAATTFYVDCAGSDANAGTSPASAWRTLAKAGSAPLAPGGSLLLMRGCSWTGPLRAGWHGTASAPVTIGDYGSGALPRIQNAHENVAITGTYLVIEHLATRADPTGYDAGCQYAPMGWRVGFRLMSGAAYDTIRDSTATGQYYGVLVEASAHDNRILGNTLTDNNMKDPNIGSDAGAVAVNLMGDHNEVAYNRISGSDACSRFYGRDGAAVEVYGGRYNSIHNNRASQNNNFSELGLSRSSDNTYAYNQVVSSLPKANFLVTRGSGDRYGPVYRTKAYNNTVYLSGSSSYAMQCTGGCSPDVLSFRNNIVWANGTVGYADHPFDESNDIYWRSGGSPKVWFAMSSTSRKADPGFESLSAPDLRLAAGSPALDAACAAALTLGYATDVDGTSVPQGSGVDIGAHEGAGAAVAGGGTTGATGATGAAGEALGVSPSGPFTTRSLATRIGTYVTFRMTLGAAYAGKTVAILAAHRNADGTWGPYARITARIANGRGDVLYYRRSALLGWWSFRASSAGDASVPAATTHWAMARWY